MPLPLAANNPAALQSLLAAIVESSGDAIISRDLQGIVASWNPAAERIFGYSAQEMIGHSINVLIPPERHVDVALIPDHIRQGQPICDFETVRLRKDGTRILVSLTVSPIRDAAGEIVAVSSIARDITAQRRTEQALRESEERWKFALEGSGEGVWDWNIQTGEANFSPRWKQMLGYTDQELANELRTWEQLVHAEDLPQAQAAIQAYLVGDTAGFATEFRMRSKDGFWRWILSRGKIVSHTPEGQPLRMIGTHADITERKEAELQARFMAYHDRLTGLPNRTLFFDRLSHAISHARRNRKKVALLFGDLDGFKYVNDQHGHDAGDIVLKHVAARLVSCVRAVDTVARVGGDEFVVILGGIEHVAEATTIASKLIASVVQPITLTDAAVVRVGLSVGVSLYPNHGTEMDTLLAAADAAMYQSKAAGRGQLTVFDNSGSRGSACDDWAGLDAARCIGIAVIDQQHQRLAALINRLNLAVRDKVDEAIVQEQFQELADYTAEHFATEHELMERFHYPGQSAHDAIHARLLADTLQFRSRLNKGGDLFVLQSLKDWLMHHIQTEDRALGEFLKTRM
jgi:diguanylate cyclase (GGDEF)-like protein/PAS domain S-box-containing protein/hemerythrin-like metal-binding protein